MPVSQGNILYSYLLVLAVSDILDITFQSKKKNYNKGYSEVVQKLLIYLLLNLY